MHLRAIRITMSEINFPTTPESMTKIRLSAWAKSQGISRITAYRMLNRGVLNVPVERSPTGRWYVLIPRARSGRIAYYVRATPSLQSSLSINSQIEALAHWSETHRQRPFVVVREIAPPYIARLPKLANLLADDQISDILVQNVSVIGESAYTLMVAALSPQGRSIILVESSGTPVRKRRLDLEDAIHSLQ